MFNILDFNPPFPPPQDLFLYHTPKSSPTQILQCPYAHMPTCPPAHSPTRLDPSSHPSISRGRTTVCGDAVRTSAFLWPLLAQDLHAEALVLRVGACEVAVGDTAARPVVTLVEELLPVAHCTDSARADLCCCVLVRRGNGDGCVCSLKIIRKLSRPWSLNSVNPMFVLADVFLDHENE